MNLRVCSLTALFVLATVGCDTGAEPTAQRSPRPASPTAVPSPSAAPTPTLTPAPKAPTCSATGVVPDSAPQEGLPLEVQQTRRLIFALAGACRFDDLEKLALEGRDFFSFSFGDDRSPARYWRRDDPRFETLATLIKILDLPYTTDEFQSSPDEDKAVVYSWPSANRGDPTEEDWQLLIDAGLYTEREVQRMKEFGGYIGYRIGIVEDGDWIYFIAGD